MRYNGGMRFEVPQFIEVEDKIIGPLTWKQSVYIGGGIGVIVMFYLIIPSFIFFVILSIPFGALAGSLAFHRVNNRPFSIFLESFVNYFSKSKLYLWRKDTEQSIVEKTAPVPTPAPNLGSANKKSINSLARKLEMHHAE